MKKIVCILLLAFPALLLLAQNNMSVSSFRLLEQDLTAITNGTLVIDRNGKKAALIKVVTTQKEFVFEAGMMGIEKIVQKTGEIWVYVSEGSRKLTIKHGQFGTLRDYEYPSSCPIKAGCTYELVLNVKGINNDRMSGILDVTVKPTSAIFIIDNGNKRDTISLDNKGHYVGFYPYGDYIYYIEQSDYMQETGTFTITPGPKTSLDISLKSSIVNLKVECLTDGCEIYINKVSKGTVPYFGKVKIDSSYMIEVKKDGYRSDSQIIKIENQDTSLSIPSLVPIFGSLMAKFRPAGASVYINGVKRGKCSEIIKSLPVGEYEVTISMEGYQSHTEIVSIEENHRTDLSGILEKIPLVAPAVSGSGKNDSPKKSVEKKTLGGQTIRVYDEEFSSHFCDMYMGYDSEEEETFTGFNYSWVRHRIGPYLSVGVSNYKAFSAFGGVTWRLTNPVSSPVDWQLNGGIGYLDRSFGGELSTRFAWRTLGRLSKWDFGIGCQISKDRIMPTVSFGLCLWVIPLALTIGVICDG